MFQPVSSRVNFAQEEEKILAFWKENDIFAKTTAERPDAPRFVFYEGPPTANGRPGIHHVLARSFKDVILRYWVMRGYYVLRKGGWDTHGLPVEIEVEKKLGFTNKKQIEDYGIKAFNDLCRESVFTYVDEWKRITDRIAFWVDMEDPYVTLHNKYVESLWWILKQFWDQGLLYEGYKVVPYCPRCGTPLSSHELSLGYREGTKDPSVTIKFAVKGEPNTYFLVWTTTPWTLPANVALAVGEDIDYVLVQQGGERYYLAKALLDSVMRDDYELLAEMKGKALAGKRYEPLYTFLPVSKDYAYVVTADFVSIEEGTGIVHMAPAFGADDMEVGKAYDLPLLMTVDAEGKFINAITPWKGIFVKDADPLIEEELEQRGLMYQKGIYEHTYPFCWRCGTPLLYYARSTWYVATTKKKDELLENNEKINWYPQHLQHGRFGNWLENNVDWALGRNRYWGTPLPVWRCDDPACDHMEAFGSVAELAQRAGKKFVLQPDDPNESVPADATPLDLHRPDVDEIVLTCPKCGGTMHRVPELVDVWFDSGSMPVAQWHYPFENQEMFQEQYPADFICEAVDQTRGWFYTLHAVSTMLFDQPSFKNVLSLGLIMAEDGSKMSKSKGNVVDPWQVVNAHGADAVRWYMYTASPAGQTRRFSSRLVQEVVKGFMNTLWNSYSFFITYANIAAWTPAAQAAPSDQLLDRWLLAELHALIRDVTERMRQYDPTYSARRIESFVDALSNWYVRQSRRRFWEGEPAALQTLYTTLRTLSQLLAPFMPFTAEMLWQNLVGAVDASGAESVHLSDWPEADEALIDEALRSDVALVQRLVRMGHAARQKANIKVRQPLAEIRLFLPDEMEREQLPHLAAQLLAELNVKQWQVVDQLSGIVTARINAKPQLLGPKYGRLLGSIRKALNSGDVMAMAVAFQAGESIPLTLDGQTVTINADEVDVLLQPLPGFVMVEEAGYVVALNVALDDALRREGIARELVRYVQNLRKEAGFAVTDRINLYVQGPPALQQALASFGDYVQSETLTLDLQVGALPADLPAAQFKLPEGEVQFAIEQRPVAG